MTSPTAGALDQAALLEQRRRLQALVNFVANAGLPDELLTGAQPRLLELFQCERTTLFALDTKNRHLYSLAKTGGEFREIRVALDLSSIAGFVGVSKRTLNIANVYEADELKRIHPQLHFDDRWDQASGFTTRSVLCVPVLHEGNLLGVLQLINRKDKLPFAPRDAAVVDEVARSLAMSFFNINRNRSLRAGTRPGKWDALVDGGAISEVDLQAAEEAAAAGRWDLPRYLVEKAGVKRHAVEQAMGVYYDCEVFRFTGKEAIPEDLRKKVRAEFLKQNCAAPLERRGNMLLVVIDDPEDLGRSDALRAIEPSLKMALQVGFRDEIIAYIESSYGQRGDVGSILRELSAEDKAEAVIDADAVDDGKLGESDSAVIKLANQIILDAYRRGASDIHIEPNGKERNTTVRFRVDGDCAAYQDIPSNYRMALVARLKIMANLDISERRKPQDGKIRFKIENRVVELRVATIPTVNGNEDVVMRILAAQKPLPLDQMGMSERNLSGLKSIIVKPYGLILCVGPTGSGKTTTLHSALGHINTIDMKIWTAEDPVEITQAGLRQVQVQPKIGFSFEAAMRSFLRADPDVIMVGEMRDRETAETGVEASLTGHLVFSTLHTNSAPETVTRLIDMGLDPFSFADALLGVLAQRLARAICKSCREPMPATAEERETIVRAFGGREEGVAALRARGVTVGVDGALVVFRGRGCEACGGTGYKGRVAVHELLITDDAMKLAIARKAPVDDLRRLSVAGGMTTLLQDGIEKALGGITDLKQVLAVCSR